MLQKPDISDEALISCLRDAYGLNSSSVAFLPLGADRDTAVYRASDDAGDYFVKLRRHFDAMSILIPAYLHEQSGLKQVIAPLRTQSGLLWTDVAEFKLSVFPFIEGQNAYDTPMSDDHMLQFGQTLKGLHTAKLPPELVNRIQREAYTDLWRDKVRKFQQQIDTTTYDSPVSAGLAELLTEKRPQIDTLVNGAHDLASNLMADPRPFAPCHADIHVWNVLIDKEGRFYIIDWDTIIFAPVERDLMFIGSGLGGKWNTPHEQALFYQGYGPVAVDRVALAYYRMERIVQDIAAYCDLILNTDQNEDRAIGLQQLKSQFNPGGIVDIAIESAEGLQNASKHCQT